jgi:hypothetical protein
MYLKTDLGYNNMEKICITCKENLDISLFNKNKNCKDGYMSKCKPCRKKYRDKKKDDYKDIKPIDGKICSGCRKYKTKNKYSKSSARLDKLQTSCKECQHQRMKKIYKQMSKEDFIKGKFKELARNAKTRNIQVNITYNDIIDLYAKQNGKCALTDIELTFDKYTSNDPRKINKNNISVDRIDSKKPYSKDNIQLITAQLNQMKWDVHNDLFIKTCIEIANFDDSKNEL